MTILKVFLTSFLFLITSDHSLVLDFILTHEGRKLNTHEPASVGGISFQGITQKTYSFWRNKQDDKELLPLSVADLINKDDLIRRFYKDYLDEYHVFDIPQELQLLYGDMSVMSGHHAVMVLQQIINVKPDGIFGHRTRIALESYKLKFKRYSNRDKVRIIHRFDKLKRNYLEGLIEHHPLIYGDYEEGWIARADDALNLSLSSIRH